MYFLDHGQIRVQTPRRPLISFILEVGLVRLKHLREGAHFLAQRCVTRYLVSNVTDYLTYVVGLHAGPGAHSTSEGLRRPHLLFQIL